MQFFSAASPATCVGAKLDYGCLRVAALALVERSMDAPRFTRRYTATPFADNDTVATRESAAAGASLADVNFTEKYLSE